MQWTLDALLPFADSNLGDLARKLGVACPTGTASQLRAAAHQALCQLSLPELLSRLSQAERSALALATHDPNRRLDANRYHAIHGCLPQQRTLLLRLLMPDGRVPASLATELRALLVPPPSGRPLGCETVPQELTVAETAEAACRALPSLLRLIQAGRLKVSPKTGNLSAAGARAVLEALGEGDLYPWDQARASDTIRAFGWVRLLQAGTLVTAGATLQLTKLGSRALTQTPPEALVTIWKRYLDHTGFDELDRIESIQGQRSRRALTAVAPRRQALAAALAELPPDRWVEVEEFFRLVRSTGNDFEVARDPWSLYVGGSQQYGNLGYDFEFSLWPILQGRYALAFLMEYAATLGLVDLAYTNPEGARSDYCRLWGVDDMERFSRYDGLQYLRLNALGRYCLGLACEYQPARPPSTCCLRLDAGLNLAAEGSVPPALRATLTTFAQELDDRHWRLTPASVAAAATRLPLSQMEDFLEQHCQGTLPSQVRLFFEQCGRRFAALTNRGPCYLVEVATPRALEELFLDATLRRHCHPCGDRSFIFPASVERKVTRALIGLGYPIDPLADEPAAREPRVWEQLGRELEESLR